MIPESTYIPIMALAVLLGSVHIASAQCKLPGPDPVCTPGAILNITVGGATLHLIRNVMGCPLPHNKV